MSYFKRGIAVLLAAGLVAPAAFSHAAREQTSSHRIHSNYKGTTPMKRMNEMIGRNGNKTHLNSRGWMRRIDLGGYMNFDATTAQRGWNVDGVRTAGIIPAFPTAEYSTKRASSLGVTNANLLFDIRIMRNVSAHIGYVYFNPLGPVRAVNGFDEAYLTFKNIMNTPLYLRLGRAYVPYGSHDTPYPLTYSFVQLLTQTNADMVQLGYVSASKRLYGVIFAFNDNGFGGFSRISSDSDGSLSYFGTGPGSVAHPRATTINNYGAKVGYMSRYRDVRYDLEASYLKDVRATQFFHMNEHFTVIPIGDDDDADDYSKFRSAGGIALHGYFTRAAWDFLIDYTTALRDIETDSSISAKWWAYHLRGGYRFMAYRRPSKIQLGYERASGTTFGGSNSSMMNVRALTPRYRWYVDYITKLGRHMKFTVQYVYNKSYNNPGYCNYEEWDCSSNDPIPAQKSNVLNARVTVEF